VVLFEHNYNYLCFRQRLLEYSDTLLEDENGRLKKIVAQQALDIDALKVVLSKKW